ncbi:hypothetical protein [Polyangium jinanense]|uniref:Lipoprotein n=1 Tax=Polyangium jinanense TaxID=2829994 RepID=A0A9X3X8B9_9BACT|nr:hypothetical protein [Polyangium jinanense]MDC3962294.1 hypothetical protein [Polyangium jinanense]MDC3985809.1 hypothetical protein [Polyangium jinanense]
MKSQHLTLVALIAAGLGALATPLACIRHADIRDEPDSSILDRPPDFDAGGIPELDSGLGSDAYPLCADRPTGKCVGSNDFPCAFEDWVPAMAKACQEASGCKTNGWLEVQMGPDGCVEALGMEEPNDEVVACLVAEMGAVKCPCGEGITKYYFGAGNVGPCGSN